MNELMGGARNAEEIEQVLNRCTIIDGKLVPAPDVIRGQLDGEVIDSVEYAQTDSLPAYSPVDRDTQPIQDNARRARLRVGLTRAALVGVMVFVPLQSADAFISNRPFTEVNLIEDGVHAIENAAVIGDNVATTFNTVKSTTENIVKLANGGK